MQAKVVAWSAWAPGVSSLAEWRAWALSPVPFAILEKPKTATLSALQRRRCSPSTMAATHILERLRGIDRNTTVESKTTAMVFGSRHGESGITDRILRSLTDQEDVSPTDFMLSVHNSSAGMCSIAFQDTAPHSAVAAREGSMAACLLESIGYLSRVGDRVFCIFVDDVVAPSFCTESDRYDPYFGVGFLLEWSDAERAVTTARNEQSAHNASPFSLEFTWQGGAERGADTAASSAPTAARSLSNQGISPFPESLILVSWLLGDRLSGAEGRPAEQGEPQDRHRLKRLDLPLAQGLLSVVVGGESDPAGVFV